MNLVITDSGLGGLSICAQLMRLIKERAKSTLPQLPVDDLHITYVNAVPADERGYNFMSGRAEQLETFEKILLNTDKLFAPDYVFVACGTLSVLLEKLLYQSDKAIWRAFFSSSRTTKFSPTSGTLLKPEISTGIAGPASIIASPISLNIARIRPCIPPMTK